ncbi:XPG-like endonuclease isoform X1 [Rhynchophorus ferrugineus]|uniref:XPG-like endonuclease isoform X1 n=1 Tax=Rhynchophorus ferrugineus TaxID=354439 RepID=UPI003FCD7174
MGIKNLWTILAPFCDRKPLYELQGKTVAVDLSCWICEAQNIAEYQVQPRMYLRNLYFRTCYLLLMEVNPVFVLEGKAPELKYDTISARNAIQFKGAKPRTEKANTGKGRTRFNFVLQQCEQMLRYMGLACIVGKGEAESLCAYLNEDGLVDGCISQDSDCFAYGAYVVYRNFSISTQGAYAASGGAVDIYDIRKANESLKFGRNKIIAMALLVGCDYSEGVHGVGKDSVMKLFERVSDENILDFIRSWRDKKDLYDKYERQLNDKTHCSSCGHIGKVQSHTKSGCSFCKSTKGCDSTKYKEERQAIKNELTIRNKAIQDPNFPDESLINEFLRRKDNVKTLDLKWKQPDVVNFVKFASKFLQWEEYYSFEKILPILTRWQCKYPEKILHRSDLKGTVVPDKIKKARHPKGVPSYEIIWTDPTDSFKGLIPEEQLQEHNIEPEKLWSTVEPQDLVEAAYPDLAEAYRQSKIKPKKPSKRKKKTVDDLSQKMENISLSEPKPKKIRRQAKKQPTLEELLKPTEKVCEVVDQLDSGSNELKINKVASASRDLIRQVLKPNFNTSFKENFIQGAGFNSSTPTKFSQKDFSFDPDMSGFGDESDLNVTDIVDDIVSRDDVPNKLKEVAREYLKNPPQASDFVDNKDEEDNNAALNTSNFFLDKGPDQEDLFEKTFRKTLGFESDENSSDTEEYDINEDNLMGKESDEPVKKDCEVPGNNLEETDALSSEEDSFCVKYVPLFERIRNK